MVRMGTANVWATAALVTLVVSGAFFATATGPERNARDGQADAADDLLPLVLTQRSVADRIALEPMLAFTPDGTAFFNTLYTAGPQWTLTPELWRSRDKGETWQMVTPNLLGVPTGLTTGDPYIYADPASGRLFFIDFLGFEPRFAIDPTAPDPIVQQSCHRLSRSDDGGDTWLAPLEICPASDHQTLFSGPPVAGIQLDGYPSVLYLCDNLRAGPGPQGSCMRSLDGGTTWQPRVTVFPECDLDRQFGHGHASQTDGTVYLPKGACRDYSPPEWRAEGHGEAWVSISRDGGATFETVVVDDTVGFIDIAVEAHEARVTTDSEGNVYLFFLDADSRPRLSISTDQGRTWAAPLDVGLPHLTAHMLPDVVAGDAGRVAWTYVASDWPGGWDVLYEPDGSDDATWHTYVGISTDALSGAPTFETAAITPADDPVRRGPCPVRCPSDLPAGLDLSVVTGGPIGLGMYDFINMAIDPTTGYAWVSMMDTCYGACSGPDGQRSWPNDPKGAVGVQVGGVPLITGL